jgi:hypothetical protein
LRIRSFDQTHEEAIAEAANNNSSITSLMLSQAARNYGSESKIAMMLSERPGLIELAGPFDITNEIAEKLSERKELESLKVRSITSEAIELLSWLPHLKVVRKNWKELGKRAKLRKANCSNFMRLVAIMFELRSKLWQRKHLLQ